MKRAHRKWHRRLWLFLAPIIILGFILSLFARTEVPIEENAPIDRATALVKGGE